MAIHIITDSTSDLSREDQERLGVLVVPLTVNFSQETFFDGIGLSNEQFYEKLDVCEKLPTTSQVPPQTFIDMFQSHLGENDEIVGIFISSEISGTFNSACMAKEAIASDRLFIVDSRSATMGLALLVSEAAKCRDAGLSACEIAKHVAGLSKKVRLLAAVNTLKYLRKGGRISATSVVIGEMLGMKPIVSLIDGAVQSIGKARGMEAALRTIMQNVLQHVPDLRYGICFAHACTPELLDKTIARMKESFDITQWIVCSIGSVIGTYSGRGAVGLAYIEE